MVIFSRGNNVANRKFVIYYLEQEQKHFRVGISVSKKLGNAVRRNKVKRQIREIISKNDYQKNFDCIIIVRREINNADFQEIEKDLNYALEKLLLKKEK